MLWLTPEVKACLNDLPFSSFLTNWRQYDQTLPGRSDSPTFISTIYCSVACVRVKRLLTPMGCGSSRQQNTSTAWAASFRIYPDDISVVRNKMRGWSYPAVWNILKSTPSKLAN